MRTLFPVSTSLSLAVLSSLTLADLVSVARIVDQSLHKQFDNRHWTFFPTLEVLYEWMYAEEEWFAYRKCRIASDGLDVGRPNHRVFRVS